MVKKEKKIKNKKPLVWPTKYIDLIIKEKQKTSRLTHRIHWFNNKREEKKPLFDPRNTLI
jgi:hypothetical protein